MNRKATFIISIIILGVAGIVTWIIFSTEPAAVRESATKETAMLVDVITVKKDTYHPTISAMGTVQASQQIELSPQVSGRVTALSENFVPGGYVKKGEMLLQIEKADFQNRLQQRKSELLQARSELNMEMGRQRVAQKDYELAEQDLSDAEKDLVLRKPQLEAARSRVLSAESAVEQARLDLQRTTVKAPFDAHVISRQINTGSQVAAGQSLGQIAGLDTYWVEATVPLSQLPHITFPKDEEEGSPVSVSSRSWPAETSRKGRLFRLIGSLEDQTRLARILVEVEDPLAYRKDADTLPALMLGAFVEAQIQAKAIPGVVRLNRDYVRKNETVWVMKNGELDIRDVQIAFKDATHAYIREGLSDNDSVVTTNLSTVVEGSLLRLEEDADTLTNQR